MNIYCVLKSYYYINTNEITGELLDKNMISSQVKRSLLLSLHNNSHLPHLVIIKNCQKIVLRNIQEIFRWFKNTRRFDNLGCHYQVKRSMNTLNTRKTIVP